MRPFRPVYSPLFLIGFAIASPAQAQVSDIQIAPVELRLTVGEQRTFLATPYDSRGNPLAISNLTWVSLNPSVVQIQFDPNTPNVAIVTAVAVGVAQIEARSGSVRQQSVIQVVAPVEATPVLPDSVLPPNVVDATVAMVGRVEPTIFGTSPVCRVGGFVGNDLLVTSYTAIRGADQIAVTLPSGRTIDDVQVATYDLNADVAVLTVPGAGVGGLTTGSSSATETRAWALGQPGCSSTVPTSLRLAGGGQRVDRQLGNGELGAPIVDRGGTLVAIGSGGTQSVSIASLTPLINRARANAAAGTTASPGAVADRENHRYGRLVISSDATGARAQLTPLEEWHWAELAASGPTPLTFNGPVGRYQVQLLTGGQVRVTDTTQVSAGQSTPFAINLPVVAPPPGAANPPAGGQVRPSEGGGFPIAIVLVGLAAAGAGAFLLMPKDGTDPQPPDCTSNPNLAGCPGTITITVPIP